MRESAIPMSRETNEWLRKVNGVVTPSDFLTDEQREKLSGPVTSYIDPALISPKFRKEGEKVEKSMSKTDVEFIERKALDVKELAGQFRELPKPQITEPSQPTLTREALRQAVLDGLTDLQAAERFNVSRAQISRMKNLWRLRGVDLWGKKMTGPKSSAKPPNIEAELLSKTRAALDTYKARAEQINQETADLRQQIQQMEQQVSGLQQELETTTKRHIACEQLLARFEEGAVAS